MRETGLILRIGVRIVEMVMMVFEPLFGHCIGKLAVGQRSLSQSNEANMHTSWIKGASIADLWIQYCSMAGFAVFFCIIASVTYKKRK